MLKHCLAPSLRDQLNELPESLDETYERVLKEIQSTKQGRHARRLLHCLAVALRPLRVEELAEVLAFDLNVAKGGIPVFHPEWRWENQEQAVLSACSSLISIVENEDVRVIQFSHFSVKEYLTSDRLAAASADVSHYHILPEPAHLMLAHASLGVLLSLDHCVDGASDVGRGEEEQRDSPLLIYAAKHWASHVQVGNASSRLNYAMETLFDTSQPFLLAWLRIHDTEHRGLSFRGEPMPLYYAALYGFYDLIRHLVIKHPEQVSQPGGRHGSPLVAALSGKHIRVAKLLVKHGAQIHVREYPPLCYAIQLSDNARVDAVHFLLGYGAHVNAGYQDLHTPLHVAASVGCPEAVRILLEYGADVNLQDDRGQLPLHHVSTSINSHGEDGEDILCLVAQLLVQQCADVDARDLDGATPLHLASNDGRLKISRLLLDHGANPNAEDNDGRNSLHLLSECIARTLHLRNGLGVAQLLLDHGVDVNALDKDDATPLHLLCHERSISQLLIDHGAHVHAENALGQTPLHLVPWSFFDSPDVAQLFLELGADVNAQDKNQETPLHFACIYQNPETAQLLLDYGAEIDAQNAHGQTPLHEASIASDRLSYKYNDISIARLLVERGANVNARNKLQETPLHLACSAARSQLVQVLLDHGAEADAHDTSGQTPLHKVSCSFRFQAEDPIAESRYMARVLLECGVDVDAQDKDQETPLHFASRNSSLGSVEVLLEHGANVNAANVRGRTPLHVASEKKDTFGTAVMPLMRLLLEHGADVNAQDRDRATPFLLASQCWDSSIAQALFENGAEVDVVDIHGQNALHLLPQQTTTGVGSAELLLSLGVDMNARDKEERTPLHFASYYGDVHIAESLLDYGAWVDAEDILGQTPLHQVLLGNRNYQSFCDEPFFEKEYPGRFACLAERLLEYGADVNAQNKDHETSLHLASRLRFHDLARILLQYGADINVANSEGKSPLHLATGRKGKAMRRLLLAGKE
jgi:ankyrin repeat protein